MSAMVLASPGDRVKLLKAGLTGGQIEIVFIALNDYKMIKSPVLYDASAS